ncbi:MAG: cell envelope integrity protein TolA [Gammaproteobacteria bacterium]|nr:cell envelope integrity protein TolA [Gammaproteobacteria bacterium]
MLTSGIRLPSLVVSILLHAVLALLLVLNIELLPHKPVPPVANVNIVRTVTVDSAKVDAELERLRDIERKKENELKRREEELKSRIEELRRKTAVAETKRKEEEKRLAEIEKKKDEEQKLREAEEMKAAVLKKKQEEETQKKAEEERKQKEEQKRRENEEQLKNQMEVEQREQDAERLRREQGELDRYKARIKDAIRREFNTSGLPPGLSCILQIRMIPGGEVVAVRVSKPSGNPVFDRRAEVAVSKAAPLPVPENVELFEKMREINLTFAPEP